MPIETILILNAKEVESYWFCYVLDSIYIQDFDKVVLLVVCHKAYVKSKINSYWKKHDEPKN